MPAAKGVSSAPGPGQVDHRLLLVERALLGGKVEAGEDDDAVEPVRAPLSPPGPRSGTPGAPVRPGPRLDRVEHVRDPNGLAAADDVDVDALELGTAPMSSGGERRELPGHQAALRKPSRAETSAAAAAQSSPTSGSRDSCSR